MFCSRAVVKMSYKSIPSNNEEELPQPSFSKPPQPNVVPLTLRQTFCYSIGHFYNDLCSCMWFTYLMLFLQKVLQLESWMAGLLMLLGQIADAISTPLVGLGSDRGPVSGCLKKLGNRKSWHLLGTICTTITFPFIFNRCYFCANDTADWLKLLYFAPFIIIFQFGWASVQVSHLAMIPELTTTVSQITTLNSLRCGFTVVASMVVYGLFMAFLSKSSSSVSKISPDNLADFRNCALVVLGLGLVVATAFHIGTKEQNQRSDRPRAASSGCTYLDQLLIAEQESQEHIRVMKPLDWFKEIQFYQVGLIYMFSRLYINVSQVYFSFYIQYTQGFDAMYVAIFPLIVYFSAFVSSSFISIPLINRHLNRKITYFCGTLCAMAACSWLWFGNLGNELYAVSVLMGFSQSIVLVTSLALTADLISRNTESGAFVYGAMSFTDKFSNGLACQIVQLFDPFKQNDVIPTSVTFYRNVMSLIPGVSMFLAVVVLCTLIPQVVGKRRSHETRKQGDYERID